MSTIDDTKHTGTGTNNATIENRTFLVKQEQAPFPAAPRDTMKAGG